MNAKEARNLSIASGHNLPKYEQEKERVQSAIDDAARSGRCWVDLHYMSITNEAIIDELRANEFILTFTNGRLHFVRW